MPATRRAKRTRKAEEFSLRDLIVRLESLRVAAGAYSWSLSEIQNARDAQMVGDFKLPARLSDSFATDDAMYTARRKRLAPQRAIPVKMTPPEGKESSGPALRVLNESEGLFGKAGVGVAPETMVSINLHLADHGVAIGINLPTPRSDGSRVDFEHHAWPIEWVRWDPMRRSFVTQVDQSSWSALAATWLEDGRAGVIQGQVPIVHGDGRWVVYQAQEIEPWKHGAVLPGALVWARHAFGMRDWMSGSAAHGNAKIIGEMPANTKTKSKEGDDYLALLIAMASADMPVGIKPHGAGLEYLTNDSRAWEIWRELVNASRSSAECIYNGHDGSITMDTKAPGIDLRALLGVMADIAEGDLHTIERCFKSGVIDCWAAMNFGSSELAPMREYEIPDADQDDKRTRAAERRTAFYDAVERERAVLGPLGFDVSAERIEQLAKEYDVSVPRIKSAVPLPAQATPGAPSTNGAGTAPVAPASSATLLQ